MSTEPAPFSRIDYRTRFPALDGIRALAVTLVFAAHYGGGGTRGGIVLRAMNAFRKQGVIGVDIFFVLSGFLITGILFDTRNDSEFFKRFFARRSLRIFPVVYLLFAVLLLLTPIVHYEWKWRQLSFLVYLGNIFGNMDFSIYLVNSTAHPTADAALSHLWSLCVEEQFYLLFPLLVWWVRDRVKLLWISGGLCVLALMLRTAMVLIATPAICERWIPRTLPFRLDDLLMGAALALLLRGPAANRVQRSMKWILLAGLIPFLVLCKLSDGIYGAWGMTIGYTAVALAATGMIGCTLRTGSVLYRIFHLRPARILGKYSYGFYVWHLVWAQAWLAVLKFMIARLHSVTLAGLVTLPFMFAVSFLCARLSYDLFEVRFLKWKRNFEYDSELTSHTTAFVADGR